VSAKIELLSTRPSNVTVDIANPPTERCFFINRRQVALDDSVPRPDFILADIQSLKDLVEL